MFIAALNVTCCSKLALSGPGFDSEAILMKNNYYITKKKD